MAKKKNESVWWCPECYTVNTQEGKLEGVSVCKACGEKVDWDEWQGICDKSPEYDTAEDLADMIAGDESDGVFFGIWNELEDW